MSCHVLSLQGSSPLGIIMSISLDELLQEPSGPLPRMAEALTKDEVESANKLPFVEGNEEMRQLFFKLLTGQCLPQSATFLNEVKVKVCNFAHLAWCCVRLVKPGASPYSCTTSFALLRS